MGSPAFTRPLARLAAAGLALLAAIPLSAADPGPTNPPAARSALAFLDTSFENASPLWYETDADGVVQLHLLYDHERNSPNRAAGHVHFAVDAPAGTPLTFEFRNLDNVWNGQPGSVAREFKNLVISEDDRNWRSVPTESLPGNRVRLSLTMPAERLYVARVEPYRISDLDRWLAEFRRHPRVRITPIGRTVQGRELEILRIGRARAPHQVFLRARAHPWEAGGNWVLEGLVHRLLRDDPTARHFLERCSVTILPMANKDGVAGGRTRFNARGKDLNREWDRPADPDLAPENAALERWLTAEIEAGRRPGLALELHNDANGQLHISRPAVPDLDRDLARMVTLETLLRRHTWFTEGSTKETFRNPGTLGDGWLERFGIDAAVHEFNCNWIAGRDEPASARLWREYGENLVAVLDAYFADPAR